MFVSPRNCEFMRERKKRQKIARTRKDSAYAPLIFRNVLLHGMAVDYASFMAAQRSSRFLPMSIAAIHNPLSVMEAKCVAAFQLTEVVLMKITR